MRGPPPVAIDLGPDRAWSVACALMHALAAAAAGCGIWAHLGDGLDLRAGAWIALLAGVCACVGWRLAVPLRCRLEWTGQQWQVRMVATPGQQPQPCAPMVMLDLGWWMLIRWHVGRGAGIAVWAPVGRARAGSSWHALRVALYGVTRETPSWAADADAGR